MSKFQAKKLGDNGNSKSTFVSFYSRLIVICAVLFSLISVGYVVFWLTQPQRFPVTSVQVIGDQERSSREALVDAVLPYTNLGFFGLDVSAVRTAVEAVPWVKRAQVERSWPQKLVVKIEEHIPFARWNDEGVLTIDGALIYPPKDTIPNHLPKLEGPAERHHWVWEQYRIMSEVLAPSKCSIARLMLAKRGSWKLLLDNHILLVVGKTESTERLERFVDAYLKLLAPERDQIAYVDLRYTGGLAVGWRRNGS